MPEKVIVACSACATQYNVATLQPGAKFKCQKCGNINVVPTGGNAMPVPAAPRPMVRGAKPPTRLMPLAKGMGIKTSGLRKGLPTRKPDGDSDEEGMNGLEIKKKSQTPLFIGIAVGAVVLIVVIIVLASGGEKEDAALKDAREKEKAEAS